jgi:uncharacterized membrane protein
VLGWCIDTTMRTIRRWRFAPIRLFPFLPLYGYATVGLWAAPAAIATIGWPLRFLVFALCLCAFEFVAGAIILRVRGARIWDYSDRYFNLQGHTDLFHFFLWGALGLFAYHWALPAVASPLGLPGHLH